MLLQYSLDESFLLASASELFVHAFMLSWWRLLFPFLVALLVLDCWGLLEQEGKRLSIDAEKNSSNCTAPGV